MDRNPLVGVCICAVVLLVLGSLSNVVGYQTVQSTNHQTIKEKIRQKELLFQTIVDVVNNKEIQRVILKSQMSRGMFPVSDIPVITKNQLKQMYFIGLILSKFLSKSRMHSIIGKYQFNNQEMQKEISAIIEKDTILDREVTQLSNSECGCDNEQTSTLGFLWHFPVLCTIILIIALAYDYLILYPIAPILDRFGFELRIVVLALIEMILLYFLPAIIGCWWFFIPG